jgi:pimeloyl-ACP methyl ester carboxylesterase
VIIERASHSPNMEQPGRTAAVLLDFWGTHRRDGGPVRVAG